MTTPETDALPTGPGGKKRAPASTLGKKRPQTRNHLQVARGTDLIVVRVVGTGNMVTAPILTDFVERELEAGFRRFVFDLTHCRGLDSTFMGCMVGLHNNIRGDESSQQNDAVEESAASPVPEPVALSPEDALKELQAFFNRAEKPKKKEEAPCADGDSEGYVIAVNVSPECQELLNILGVDKFVKIHGAANLDGLEMATLPEKEMPLDERRRLILSAHENLVEIDKRNEAKFGAFLRTLSEELAKEAAS